MSVEFAPVFMCLLFLINRCRFYDKEIQNISSEGVKYSSLSLFTLQSKRFCFDREIDRERGGRESERERENGGGGGGESEGERQ